MVSLHRLREEYYGLPPNILLPRERLLKECVHELGHTLNLSHCEDYQCAMSRSHGVEWIDLKSASFCRACQAAVTARDALKLQSHAPPVSGQNIH